MAERLLLTTKMFLNIVDPADLKARIPLHPLCKEGFHTTEVWQCTPQTGHWPATVLAGRKHPHQGTVPLGEEAAEKTLGGALGGSRLCVSWKRTSSERCALAGLMLGGRGGFFRLLCFLSPPPAQAMPH